MEYVRLGTTGMKVSRICLGMMSYGEPSRRTPWVLDEERAEPIVRKAAEGGVTFFDTADAYSHGTSEEVTGRLLRFPPDRQSTVHLTVSGGERLRRRASRSSSAGPGGRGWAHRSWPSGC